jgi:hypothetical protein
MPILKWINDKDYEAAVFSLLEVATHAKKNATRNFNKNVIDPFSAMFEIAGFEFDHKTWVASETARQAQKTLNTSIGTFHQTILGHCKNWDNLKAGNVIDLVCAEKKIIAEVKNKHNTVTKGQLAGLYYSLDELVSRKTSIYKGYTAYYVTIIPKTSKRFDKEFTPSDKEKGVRCEENSRIREIDGASFYSIVTGEKNALENLFDTLPLVIEKCSKGKYKIKDKGKLKDFFDLAFREK